MNAAQLHLCNGNTASAGERCDASLPDNPQCAPNYHFGMLLGVDDFRAEQGFHVGRGRRQQRLLHGAGIVAGFAVSFDETSFELEVAPGHGIDSLGRDVVLSEARCLNLALWWAKHRDAEEFEDVRDSGNAFDLDIIACYCACLDRPVPAIADLCAGDAADMAHSRICESLSLQLMLHERQEVAPRGSHHLLRVWFELEQPAIDPEGKLLPDDRWLSEALAEVRALPANEQDAARRDLLREVLARAVAATPAFADAESNTCLRLARLREVRFTTAEDGGFDVQVGSVELGVREVLLPTALLQELLLTEPAPATVAGPSVVDQRLEDTTLTLFFDQPLAAASITEAVFAASEFASAGGWQGFTLTAPTYDASDPARPQVTLTLDRPPSADLLRITVIGTGSAPRLSSALIPAGAASAIGDGRNLTITLPI